MRSTILTRIVNSAIWIVSGAIVIIVRASVTQGGSVLIWTTIGGGMIIYGAGRLVWAIVKTSSTAPAPV
ncbi:hypothetical protein E6H12_01910 [Candidatus Bathyarchaeota archaeon]|nr:MAG: hypothetical protein E6H12_01910 [Candidatus Bathyarchaeota archaeon]